jgi:beta-ribofuranosylaminobenzene 5'-phosphate synthase
MVMRDPDKVVVETPSRLHFTLIDLCGNLTRIDGGIGVALNKPRWVLMIHVNREDKIPYIIRPIYAKIKKKVKLKNKYLIKIIEKIPRHVGLGSTTQLALAVAKGILTLENKNCPVEKLAEIVERGGTSGIGVGAFAYGGFILDCGHSTKIKKDFLPSRYTRCKPPPILFRYNLPTDWYFVVAIPNIKKIYGRKELNIFKKYCPIKEEYVKSLSRIILLQTLPAVVENDIVSFGTSLTAIQSIGFKKIENNLAKLQHVQTFMIENGAVGSGLSSFGPATYGVVETEAVAKRLAEKLRTYFNCTIFYTNTNNKGAIIN